jgi:KUP system potassium uptake protein
MIWRRGQRLLTADADTSTLTWPQVRTVLDTAAVPRTTGEAVILASNPEQVPQALASSITLLHAVPSTVTVLTVSTQPVPTVPDDDRLSVSELGSGVRQVIARVGFAENPTVPSLLEPLPGDASSRIYYLSDRTFVATSGGEMGRVSESIFAFMHRNATRPARYFALPDDKVVTLATHIDL